MASIDKPAEQNGFKKPMALGSKSRSFIPMTPRSLKTNSEHRNDLARQVADQSHSRGQDGQPPQKKFRSSAAPKGTRLASGYVDRAQERQKEQDDGSEDKQKRLKALEEMLKLQQIDQATFEKLRDEIGIGGDTSSTHLIKGLDFKLLERIRRGEDVENVPDQEEVETAPEADVEDELERALEKDVATAEQSKPTESNEEGVDQASVSDTIPQDMSLTRDQILQRMKQARRKPNELTSQDLAQSVEAQAKLDHSRFRKLETKPKTGKQKFLETINGRRREVLVITDKDGKTKRKTRWLDPEPDPATIKKGEDNTQAWGGDLPAEVLARQKVAAEEEAARRKAMDEEDDGDIFGGVADYDPLAELDSDDEDKAGEESVARSATGNEKANVTNDPSEDTSSTTSKPLKSTSKPRNYFSTAENAEADPEDSETKKPSHDPAILAALKRAAQIRQQEDANANANATAANNSSNDPSQTPEDQARNKALLEKLQSKSGYDDIDVDMEFGGGSRYDDEEEDDGRQKLSQWKGVRAEGEDEDDDEGGGDKKGGAKRKRGGGGKKRKGDKNSFKDVMNVIEGRKKTQ